MPDSSMIGGASAGSSALQKLGRAIAPLSAVLATAAAIAVLAIDAIPLGIAGEWVWNRTAGRPALARYVLPALTIGAYGAVVFAGTHLLRRRREFWVLLLLPVLLVAAAFMQLALFDLPSPEYALGMERWPISLYYESSSGYYAEAERIRDTSEFVAGYEEWIVQQDSFHIGTHPPGLFLLNRWLLDYFQQHPQEAERLVRVMPLRFQGGLAQLAENRRLPLPGQATISAVAIVTWALGLATVILLYLLTRIGESAPVAWTAASLWPLVPALPVFLPVGDCLYPFFATLCLTGIVWSMQLRLGICAIVAGVACWIGMTMSLAFLAIVPIVVGTVVLAPWSPPRIAWTRVVVTLLAFTAGFLLPTFLVYWQAHLNLVTVWGLNLEKHAGFYQAMPRSYLPWVIINLLEFAVMCGPAIAVLTILNVARRSFWEYVGRLEALSLCWMLTVLALDLSGRNLSEAARLWIFLTPFACIGAAQRLLFRGSPTRVDPVYLITGQAPPAPAPLDGALAVVLLCQAAILLTLLRTVEPLLPISLPR